MRKSRHKIERYAIRLEQSDGLRLRKANRIKTIHSSLAIEGNKLTEGQVSDIINGKTVVAPLRDIQEVKNVGFEKIEGTRKICISEEEHLPLPCNTKIRRIWQLNLILR